MVSDKRLEYLARSTVTAGITAEEMRDICDEVLQGRRVNRWIPVGERTPEDDTLCLGIDNDGIIWTMNFEDGVFCPDTGCSEIHITHWMPLPEPPV